jgi:hypothetical protein
MRAAVARPRREAVKVLLVAGDPDPSGRLRRLQHEVYDKGCALRFLVKTRTVSIEPTETSNPPPLRNRPSPDMNRRRRKGRARRLVP